MNAVSSRGVGTSLLQYNGAIITGITSKAAFTHFVHLTRPRWTWRQLLKRLFCVFKCLSTRALHLEMAWVLIQAVSYMRSPDLLADEEYLRT